jgi:opacity protein-like surface antigen
MKGILAAAVLAVVVSSAVSPAYAVSIVLPRAGQVGIGLQGQFGGLAQAGELGNEFGTGAGLAFRLKYRTRYDRAAGLSFETRRLDGRGYFVTPSAFLPGAGADSLPLKAVTLATYGVDLYQFFNTRMRTQEFLCVSGGLAKISGWSSNGDVVTPLAGDGLYLGVGGGLERFVYRSWAVDISARYSAVFLDGSVNHDVQVALGMTLYAAY